MPDLTTIMERASQALAQMDYLRGEALCLEALRLAREREDWAYYARILLPLQECRRQRRMIAADGRTRLGSAGLTGAPEAWLGELGSGCLLLTRPHQAEDARALEQAARRERRYVEVLYADNPPDAARWRLTAFAGTAVSCAVGAPPRAWVDRWLDTPPSGTRPGDAAAPGSTSTAQQAHDWFLDACELLGDAALAQVDPAAGPQQRLAPLERCLEVVTDHEILHQRLADAARALARQ